MIPKCCFLLFIDNKVHKQHCAFTTCYFQKKKRKDFLLVKPQDHMRSCAVKSRREQIPQGSKLYREITIYLAVFNAKCRQISFQSSHSTIKTKFHSPTIVRNDKNKVNWQKRLAIEKDIKWISQKPTNASRYCDKSTKITYNKKHKFFRLYAVI